MNSKRKYMSIGERMKNNYEDRYRHHLTRRTPVIMRLDGKAFHTLTKNCRKPFDEILSFAMNRTAIKLCQEIQGAKCAYVQSDEISILITDFDRLTTDAFFDYNIQKMVSVAAGIADIEFNQYFNSSAYGIFDCRVFNIPRGEVVNYFVWRQKDWERNSIQMLSQAYYSHNELHKKNTSDMHEMLHKKGINWCDLEDKWKNGSFMDNTLPDKTWELQYLLCPIFTNIHIRNFIEHDLMDGLE